VAETHSPTDAALSVTVRGNPHPTGLTFAETLALPAGSSVTCVLGPAPGGVSSSWRTGDAVPVPLPGRTGGRCRRSRPPPGSRLGTSSDAPEVSCLPGMKLRPFLPFPQAWRYLLPRDPGKQVPSVESRDTEPARSRNTASHPVGDGGPPSYLTTNAERLSGRFSGSWGPRAYRRTVDSGTDNLTLRE